MASLFLLEFKMISLESSDLRTNFHNGSQIHRNACFHLSIFDKLNLSLVRINYLKNNV